jgi:hypothetical protein
MTPVRLLPRDLSDSCYVAYMPQHTTQDALVTVHRAGPAIAIVAAPGWTEADWDKAVPRDLQEQYVGAWDYREIDGHEVWIINTRTLDRP